MSKIEVIKKTVQGIGNIGNYYGGLLAAKTECGGYAWAFLRLLTYTFYSRTLQDR